MTPEDPASAGEPAAAGDSPADGSAGAAKKAKKRAPRKPSARKKAAKKAAKKASAASSKKKASKRKASKPSEGDATHAEVGAFDDPPPVDSGSAGGDDAPKRKRAKRKRRARKSSTSRRSTEEGRSDAPSIPPLPDDADDAPEVDASSEGDGAGEEKRGRRRRRRGGRGKGKGKARDAEASQDVSEDDDESKSKRGKRGGREKSGRDKSERGKDKGKDKDKKGRKERKARGKKRDGDRDGRRRDSRRDGRRTRDPRAIDIVPRAPTVEEAAREKILLVNARDRDEARIALLVDGRLEEIYVELAAAERSAAGNIHRGRVQNVERGIGAAFVDLGRGQTGFLHASDLPLSDDDDPKQDVTERIKPGDEVIVQITRDSIGRKGPALTGRISFPGRYLVLMPFTSRSGISRRIPQGPERDRVRKLLRKLEVPEGMGVIVRTASETTDLAALDADLQHLLKEWQIIERKAAEPGQPGVLRGESDLAERSVRDIMPGDVSRIIVDKDDLAGRIHRLLRVWYPSAAAAADEAASVHVKAVHAAIDAPLGEVQLEQEPEAEPDPEETAAPADASEEDPVEAVADGDASAEGEPAPEPVIEVRSEDDETFVIPGDPDVDPVDDDELDVEIIEDDEVEEEPEPEPEPETPAERLARLERLAAMLPDLELHTESMPLFHKYNVETQLEDAYRRSARLPSGGSIVIDQTEALVAVDVNSGRLTDEIDPESTALVTNLEAVDEAARQLRLRDLGGLVVIDFIDMRDRKSRRKVEKALDSALSADRARIRMGRMDPFGLVVLSRQRIRQALTRVTHEACVACGGTGRRRQVSGLGLRVVREMEARIARSRGRGGLEVRAPSEVIAWIKKNRAGALKQLKRDCSGPVTLETDNRLAADGWAMKGLPPKDGAE